MYFITAPNKKSEKNNICKAKLNYGKKMVKYHWQLYLIILLPLLYLIVFKYVPMCGILIAFKKYSITKGIWGSPWVGLKYFKQFFSTPSCITTIKNTIGISLYFLIAGFPLPIILAIALNEAKSKLFKKTVQMVTYAPYFISTVVMVGIIFQLLDPTFGIINKPIVYLFGSPIYFMNDPKLFKSVYVWTGIWQITGYSSIIYIAALAGVDPELEEASIIDGASKFKKIVHIDIPAIAPTIVIMLILNVGNLMSLGFEKVYLMQNALNTTSCKK